jgi:hypothetical protein
MLGDMDTVTVSWTVKALALHKRQHHLLIIRSRV